jgi:hypothetical protein
VDDPCANCLVRWRRPGPVLDAGIMPEVVSTQLQLQPARVSATRSPLAGQVGMLLQAGICRPGDWRRDGGYEGL